MIGPITRWRNRRAVRAVLRDDDFLTSLAEADEACAADLAELEAAGVTGEWVAKPGPDFGEWIGAEPDPATDGVEHD